MNCINGGNDQLPKRSEEKKFFGNDSEHCNTSARSSSSSSSDPPLSEYELFRLKNIKRNEARLIQLGLLVPDAIPAKRDKKQSSIGSASTSLLLASPQKTHKGKKRSDTTPLPRRLLPKRQCTKSRVDGYASDESSIVASPILPKRTLTLQPHQVAAAGEGAFPRRERRGRPKLEDYVYVCEEVCSHCGGEWKLDGDEVEEEETKLIRCKDCRGAFHLHCMLLHGKNEDNENAKENTEVLCQGTGKDEIIQKRCFLCECNKSKRVRRASAPTLEAAIAHENLSVRINPEPILEAVIGGRNVTCYITQWHRPEK